MFALKSPFAVHTVSGKPNSVYDTEDGEEDGTSDQCPKVDTLWTSGVLECRAACSSMFSFVLWAFGRVSHNWQWNSSLPFPWQHCVLQSTFYKSSKEREKSPPKNTQSRRQSLKNTDGFRLRWWVRLHRSEGHGPTFSDTTRWKQENRQNGFQNHEPLVSFTTAPTENCSSRWKLIGPTEDSTFTEQILPSLNTWKLRGRWKNKRKTWNNPHIDPVRPLQRTYEKFCTWTVHIFQCQSQNLHIYNVMSSQNKPNFLYCLAKSQNESNLWCMGVTQCCPNKNSLYTSSGNCFTFLASRWQFMPNSQIQRNVFPRRIFSAFSSSRNVEMFNCPHQRNRADLKHKTRLWSAIDQSDRFDGSPCVGRSMPFLWRSPNTTRGKHLPTLRFDNGFVKDRVTLDLRHLHSWSRLTRGDSNIMAQQRSKAPVNMVHRHAVQSETVKKELKSAILYENFTINPHSLKKNSKSSSWNCGVCDENLRNLKTKRLSMCVLQWTSCHRNQIHFTMRWKTKKRATVREFLFLVSSPFYPALVTQLFWSTIWYFWHLSPCRIGHWRDQTIRTTTHSEVPVSYDGSTGNRLHHHSVGEMLRFAGKWHKTTLFFSFTGTNATAHVGKCLHRWNKTSTTSESATDENKPTLQNPRKLNGSQPKTKQPRSDDKTEVAAQMTGWNKLLL